MKYVYVAGPYTNGDPVINTQKAIGMGEKLLALGYVPFIPHLSHLWHLISPHDYQYWMDLDSYWLFRCDALLRLPGSSQGADLEVLAAKERGIPVYYSLDELKSSLND